MVVLWFSYVNSQVQPGSRKFLELSPSLPGHHKKGDLIRGEVHVELGGSHCGSAPWITVDPPMCSVCGFFLRSVVRKKSIGPESLLMNIFDVPVFC